MKEQINRYARGVMEYDPPKVTAEENSIFAVVDKNREFKGELRLHEADGRNIKGIVYSSNDQVIIDDGAFFGSNVSIKYYVKSDDAVNGDIIEGVFNVVSNGGEITIPYSFRIEAGSHDTMTGQVRNLFQFAQLVQNNIDEAVTLFEADDFKEVFLSEDLSLRCVYENLERGNDVRNNIEEFLVSIRKKKKTDISIPDNSRVYDNVDENFKDSLVLEKDVWGYVGIRVSCDAPFIKLERRMIDSDSFTGNRYEFSYLIDADKLHAGKNYGKIVFETINKVQSFYIVARKGDDRAANKASEHKLIYNLIALYIRFRTKSIHVNEWIRESGIVIEALRALDENNTFYKLALAQLYIAEKKDEKAKEIIENVKDEVSTEREEDYPLYCYFIYVNTLYNRDWSYSKRAATMIKECYDKYEDWRILWTLLFIDEELEGNPSLKLLKIKEQFNRGCISPVMYLEACRTFNRNPALLRVLNNFEINVLIFGAKNKFLEEKLIDRALELIETTRNRTRKIVKLMLMIWEIDNTKPILEGLCRTLIRNNYVGEKYLHIYEAGIKAEIKITQLFEYYMMCRNPNDMSPMPKMVLMYFGYNNNLDYLKKAYLYANITNNRFDNPQAYRTYLPQMEIFVKEQCEMGHINDHLCVLYRNLITPDLITKENARAISDLFFTYKITTDNVNYNKIIVRHKELRTEQEYDINKKSSYVRIYTDDPSISFVSQRGNRFSGGVFMTMTRILEDDSIVKKCLEADDSLESVKLHYCEKMLKYQKQNMDSIEKIRDVLGFNNLNDAFRRKLVSTVIAYYYDSFDAEKFDLFLSSIDASKLTDGDIVKTIEIKIIQGEYAKAYELLKKHSAMHIIPKRLMKLCSKIIVTTDDNKKRLLELSFLVFKNDAYDELIIQYLTEFYNGSTEDMLMIWKCARKLEIDTFDLEERILAQMMFTGYRTDEMIEVFSNYYSHGPRDRIVEAYLSYHSYLYFVKEESIPEEVFELIEVSFENEKELSDICKIALMKFYSEKNSLSEFRREVASKTLYTLARKGIVFPFYLNLKDEIRLPYDIADRTMVEYRTNPKNRVIIHYVYENKEHKKKYVSEDMKQIYEGIFVKQFVIFYGESLQYYITEESAGKESVTDSVTLTNHSTCPDKTDGRYEALNDIIACNEMHEDETFRKLVHSYAVNDYVTSQLFKTL